MAATRSGLAIERVFGFWLDFAFDIDAIAGSEEYVIVYGRFRATSIKTRKQLDMPLAEVWHIPKRQGGPDQPIYSDTKLALDILG